MSKIRHSIAAWTLMVAATMPSMAQTDVTELFLSNWGFDSNFNYDKTATGNVAQEILDVDGWSKGHSVDYTIVGTYEFGTAKTFNTNGRVPTEGYDGSQGCLALSTGWEQSLIYTQAVTLPIGSYHLQAAWYNGSNTTAGTSLVGWIPNSGTSVLSTVTSFKRNDWTLDEVAFKLTKSTAGKVQIGLKAAAGGSANTAKPVLDYVKIIMDDDAKALTLIRSYLKTALTDANKQYGTGTGIGADVLKQAIDEAQAAYDDDTQSFAQLFAIRKALLQATDTYINNNASESNPRNITADYLVNPSFENGTEGWEIGNMATQTNSYFSQKNSSTYLESWVGIGSQLGNASALQTIKNLPLGKYKLTAAALHIQQSASNSTTNKGAVQTGAVLYANGFSTPITKMTTYTVNFTVMDETSDVQVGIQLKDATGNWVCVDNFKLYYTGALDAAALTATLQNELQTAHDYMEQGIQNSVLTLLQQAIAQAEELLASSTPESEEVTEAIATLQEANRQAAASRSLYLNIETALVYARKVSDWWKDTPRKATAWNNLQTAIITAEEQLSDFDLTDTQLTKAVTTLNTKVKAVDKGIYESDNAVGKGAALNDPNSNFCYQRSLQSKHWILFWEKGYGSERPSGIDDILNTADQIFEFYADSLKFITINQGKSKTDNYKMIIRLRASSEWEANGSGIDNTIGMLTLSRWAYTSRGGQTVAHEIGHCFQYQVHNDNNNWNGWMYTWADSPNGNVFWEMCAQWQAYKFYPHMQFNGNEWLTNTLNGLHKNPFSEELRYNNFFIQDYMVQKHGMDFLGRLWNESQNPEDPFQAYMRMTMTGTTSAKLAKLGDEMYDYAAHMTTFDFDHIRTAGASTVGKRNQTSMKQIEDKYWLVNVSDCPENYGNNAIYLNVPNVEKKLVAEFVGLADITGYRGYKTNYAGWRMGFVALKNDGTRIYSDVTAATKKDPDKTIEFVCPAGCKYVWFVVSGAPTSYWCRGWDGTADNDEQWPYKVRFYNTNLLGKTNTPLPTAIDDIVAEDEPTTGNVYNLQGKLVRQGSHTQGLPSGIYIVGGKKIAVK